MTQWAKQQACWDYFSKVDVGIPTSIERDLISGDESRTLVKDARKQRAMDTGFESVQQVLAVVPAVWESVYGNGGLSPMEGDLVQLFGLRKGKVPTERQAGAIIRLLTRMADNGVIPRNSF